MKLFGLVALILMSSNAFSLPLGCRAGLQSPETLVSQRVCAEEARATARRGLIAAAVAKMNRCNDLYGTNETIYSYDDCVEEARTAQRSGLIAAAVAKMKKCEQMFRR